MKGLWLSSWFSLSTRLILSLGNGRNVSFVLVFVDMLGNDASWKGQSLRTEAPPRHRGREAPLLFGGRQPRSGRDKELQTLHGPGDTCPSTQAFLD